MGDEPEKRVSISLFFPFLWADLLVQILCVLEQSSLIHDFVFHRRKKILAIFDFKFSGWYDFRQKEKRVR